MCVTTSDEKCGEEEFVLLGKEFQNSSDAYEHWLHVIGKLIKKDENSKYFAKRKKSEYLNNGTFSTCRKDDLLQLVQEAIEIEKQLRES